MRKNQVSSWGFWFRHGKNVRSKNKNGTYRVMAGLFLELAWSLAMLSHCQSHRDCLIGVLLGF